VSSRRALHRVALVALLLGSCGAEAPPQQRGDVGVAPFVSMASDSSAAPDIATALAQRLGGQGIGAIVPPSAIGEYPEKPSTAERVALRDRTGVRTLVTGSVTPLGDAFAIDARVLDLDSGETLGEPLAEKAADQADLPRALDALAQGVAARLAAPVAERPREDKPRRRKPSGEDELREPIEMQGDTLDVQSVPGGRKLSFTGHVNAVQGDIRLECDQLEAMTKGDTSQPEQVVAKGNVVVKQRDRTAKCDEAIFYRTEDKLVCTGSPAELTEECNRAEALRITFFLESEKVEMSGNSKVFGRDCGTP
jgi:lipopolysaccharide transport protein LptA